MVIITDVINAIKFIFMKVLGYAPMYNVWKFYKEQEDFEEKCEQILTHMMAECAKEFEKLPILLDVEILRNILYSGVWDRFDKIKKHEDQPHVMEKL